MRPSNLESTEPYHVDSLLVHERMTEHRHAPISCIKSPWAEVAHLLNAGLSIDAADNIEHMPQGIEAWVLELRGEPIQLVINGIPQ